MQKLTYPIGGETKNNIEIRVRPRWVEWFLPRTYKSVSFTAFGKLWVPYAMYGDRRIDLKDFIYQEPSLWFFKAHLEQQEKLPLWGLGWHLGHIFDKEERLMHNIPAWALVLNKVRAFPEKYQEELHYLEAVALPFYRECKDDIQRFLKHIVYLSETIK